MPLYQVNAGRLAALPPTTFVTEKVMQRKDLQLLLLADIAALGDDLMVKPRTIRLVWLQPGHDLGAIAAIAAVEAALLVQGVPVGCGGTRRAVMSLAGG